ncbi:2'-5' RNA ligase family protein [Candidatus Pacearchaeota archaeon]|nr:2'-5' RNA ligase family protein [Candidatus Pacearchaeota archaeon]
MGRYSVTLNFFLPQNIVSNLEKVDIQEDISFDWRKSSASHCTVKAIYISDKLPSKKELNAWVADASNRLNGQSKFKVQVKGISKFPNIIFADVHSEKLVKLHKSLFDILPSSQPQFEGENYVPHASMVVLKNPSKSDLKNNQLFGEFEVKEIQLVIWNTKNLDKPEIYHKFILN